MTAEGANVALVRRWFEMAERGEVDAFMERIDEIFDLEAEFSPLLAREIERRSYRGRAEIRGFFQDLGSILGEIHFAPAEFHPVSENVIVVFTRLFGTGRGSNVPIGQDLALVCEIHDRLIRRLSAYGTREEALEAAMEAQRA
jgi:ketosteroid isomerase-like protein